MATNSQSAVKCIECGERLPWAAEAEKQLAARTQAAKAAQQAAPPAKAANVAAARPAKTPSFDDDDTEWWLVVGGGILLLAVAAFGFWRFSLMETSGGLMRTRWYIALLYSLGGKWLVAGLVGGLGVLCIVLGIFQYLEEKKSA